MTATTTEPASAADGDLIRDAHRGEAPAAEPAEPLPLRRNRNFTFLWGGSVAAMLGLSTADLAYPLAILAITGSPLKAGLFATVQLVASVLATLPVGQLLDRRDRHRLLLLSESVRTLAAAGVAVSYFLGTLTFWQLMATAAALGAIQPFAGGRTLLIREVVAPEQVPAALTREQLRNHSCELAGPPLGGALFAASRALPFAFAAVAAFVSLISVLLLKLPKATSNATAQAPDAKPEGGVLLGIRIIFGNPVMRATMLTLCLVNTAGYPVFVSLVVRMRDLGAGSGVTGLVVAAMALGGLAGTALVKPLHRALRPGWVLIVACAAFAGTDLGMTLLANPWADAAMLLIGGAFIPSAVVMVNVLIIQAVPDEQRGRTAAALQMFLLIGMPLGMLTAGVSLQWFSPTATLLGLAALMSVTALYAVSQRALRAAGWPEEEAAAQSA